MSDAAPTPDIVITCYAADLYGCEATVTVTRELIEQRRELEGRQESEILADALRNFNWRPSHGWPPDHRGLCPRCNLEGRFVLPEKIVHPRFNDLTKESTL